MTFKRFFPFLFLVVCAALFFTAPITQAAIVEDYIDVNNTNVDGSSNIGTASNFTAQKYGPDSINDTLTEADPNSFNSLNASIFYRDSTTSLNTPKQRVWTTSWQAQTELATSGSPVRWVRTVYSPIRVNELITITLSDDRYLDAYVWNGTNWTVTNNIGYMTGTTFYKGFDIAYEKTTGRALLVYSRGVATTNEIGYRIWTYGSGWSDEQLLNPTYTSGIVYWISLATAPGTRNGNGDDNEIAMIYIDAAVDVLGYTWNGTASAWSLMGATAVWDATAAIATKECIVVAYEQTSGRALFLWADTTSTDFYYKTWDGTTLLANTLLDISTAGGIGSFMSLKSNPVNDGMMLVVVDAGLDLNTRYWDGTTWTVHSEHDAAIDSMVARCADFAWEPTGSKGLLVWGTATGVINWKSFTAPNTWPSSGAPAMAGGIHPWVQLRTNTNSTATVKILGAILTGTVFDIGAVSWNGAAFTIIGVSTISASTTVITYECFSMYFMQNIPNYRLDIEEQFTNVDNVTSFVEKKLCVFAGPYSSAETITVKAWNTSSSAWVSLGTLTANQWNNISIGTFPNATTFTITFVDGTQTSDGSSSNWQVDAVLLYLRTAAATYPVISSVTTTITLTTTVQVNYHAVLNQTTSMVLNVSSVNITYPLNLNLTSSVSLSTTVQVAYHVNVNRTTSIVLDLSNIKSEHTLDLNLTAGLTFDTFVEVDYHVAVNGATTVNLTLSEQTQQGFPSNVTGTMTLTILVQVTSGAYEVSSNITGVVAFNMLVETTYHVSTTEAQTLTLSQDKTVDYLNPLSLKPNLILTIAFSGNFTTSIPLFNRSVMFDVRIVKLAYIYGYEQFALTRNVAATLNLTNAGTIGGDAVVDWWIVDAAQTKIIALTETVFVDVGESKLFVCRFC